MNEWSLPTRTKNLSKKVKSTPAFEFLKGNGIPKKRLSALNKSSFVVVDLEGDSEDEVLEQAFGAPCYSTEILNQPLCDSSIVDLHRSRPTCAYELCLSCCHEIREGSLSSRAEMKFQYVDRGSDYVHDGDPLPCDFESAEDQGEPTVVLWNANDDGSISCAPKEMGCCGDCVLELKLSFQWDAFQS
ncbi:hypothetical protein GH714_000444 [Hevea brasiliensis]|uniref:Uncharacterized protein n=1 Tax=Hevea brasiliensis TaxID=3981 RepID=A0A6A6LWL5_HEVBR|nr:hypothetical protein GH714_000444 [Hevea brasiliensis]